MRQNIVCIISVICVLGMLAVCPADAGKLADPIEAAPTLTVVFGSPAEFENAAGEVPVGTEAAQEPETALLLASKDSETGGLSDLPLDRETVITAGQPLSLRDVTSPDEEHPAPVSSQEQVPEPSTLILLAFGLLGMAGFLRRKRL